MMQQFMNGGQQKQMPQAQDPQAGLVQSILEALLKGGAAKSPEEAQKMATVIVRSADDPNIRVQLTKAVAAKQLPLIVAHLIGVVMKQAGGASSSPVMQQLGGQ